MSADPIGIYAEQVAKRESAVSRLSPAARHAAFPKLYAKPYVAPGGTRITVNCLTGERTIERITPAPKPQAAPPKPEIRVIGGYPVEFRRAAAAVCRAFDVHPDWLLAPGKSIKVADARAAVFRLMWHMHHWTYVRTSQVTGRDMSGVRKGLVRAAQLYNGNHDWRTRFDAARAELTRKSAGTDGAGAS